MGADHADAGGSDARPVCTAGVGDPPPAVLQASSPWWPCETDDPGRRRGLAAFGRNSAAITQEGTMLNGSNLQRCHSSAVPSLTYTFSSSGAPYFERQVPH